MFCLQAFASLSYQPEAPKSRIEYCSFVKDRENFLNLFVDDRNNVSLDNEAGILKINGREIGICWWQSRFVRNANLLGIFKPELKLPKPQEARKIIHKIIEGHSIVEIPGVSSLWIFSEIFKNELKESLEAWQLREGLLGSWVKAIVYGREKSAEQLKNTMEELFYWTRVEKLPVLTLLLSSKTFGAHSAIIVNVNKYSDSYAALIVDPNYTKYEKWNFKLGNSLVTYTNPNPRNPYIDGFVPHLTYKKELTDILDAQFFYCNPKKAREMWIVRAQKLLRRCEESKNLAWARCDRLGFELNRVKYSTEQIPAPEFREITLENNSYKLEAWNKLF